MKKLFEQMINMSYEEKQRIQKLLNIQCLDVMTDEEKLTEAKKDDYIGLYYVNFEDGSHLTYDIVSGENNYYDNIVWTSKDGEEKVVFDCFYEIPEMIEFETKDAKYRIFFEDEVIVDEKEEEIFTDNDYDKLNELIGKFCRIEKKAGRCSSCEDCPITKSYYEIFGNRNTEEDI